MQLAAGLFPFALKLYKLELELCSHDVISLDIWKGNIMQNCNGNYFSAPTGPMMHQKPVDSGFSAGTGSRGHDVVGPAKGICFETTAYPWNYGQWPPRNPLDAAGSMCKRLSRQFAADTFCLFWIIVLMTRVAAMQFVDF